jgi:hypothetical protein
MWLGALRLCPMDNFVGLPADGKKYPCRSLCLCFVINVFKYNYIFLCVSRRGGKGGCA